MNQQTVHDVVVEVLAGIAPDGDFTALDPRRSLREQLDLDSLDFLAFVERLSERTGVPVREEDYPTVDTLAGCTAFLSGGEPER
jgi:acyl carrier protein